MAKVEPSSATWSCIDPFSVWVDGRPEVYEAGAQVAGDHPILRTHQAHFQQSVVRAPATGPVVEAATAAPGEARRTVQPVRDKGETR